MWLICLSKLEPVDKVDNRGIILQPCNMDIKLAYLQEYHTLIKLFTCAASLVASPPLLLGSMVPRGAQLAPPPSGAGTTEHQGRCKPHGIGVRTLSFAGPVLHFPLMLSGPSAATWAAGVVYGSGYHHFGVTVPISSISRSVGESMVTNLCLGCLVLP